MLKAKTVKFAKSLYHRFKSDEVPAIGSQLAYHLLLAFFPFLIFLVTLSGYIPYIDIKLLNELSKVLPPKTYDMVVSIIEETLRQRSGTLLSFGMIATLFIASNGLSSLIKGLNKAYRQKETRPLWKVKGLSVVYTLGLALIIVFIFVLVIFGQEVGRFVFDLLDSPVSFKTTWNFLRYIVSVIAVISVLVSIYMFFPNKRLGIKEVLPGSIFSTFAWLLISEALSLYVSSFSNIARTYGSIGGIIVLMIWLYWSGIILIMGGEINATLATWSNDGSKLR